MVSPSFADFTVRNAQARGPDAPRFSGAIALVSRHVATARLVSRFRF